MSEFKSLCIKLGILILSCVFQACYIDAQGCTGRRVEAVCNLRPDPTGPNSPITGTVRFTQTMTCYHAHRLHLVRVQGEITGLPQSESIQKHGFHVHANGDLRDGCRSMGSHYNPLNTVHGRPADVQSRRHVGDLGNVIADRWGNVTIDFIAPYPVSLYGDMSIIGRGIVLHEGEDDLGRGGNPGSIASGNAGARIACCIIERV
ncbi:superoxide dismutase [Cu-Zn]-like [Mercenaria mercenaria]|uniref:superoxide dismutase [Cu-Zn]-like n=1 Tax=Mercenaria mercenaria TaxID=6596 RepID=UPI00234F8613|nr:superoxide dismutase [Cu-Zn]-like [Mercenaria mercenaria]